MQAVGGLAEDLLKAGLVSERVAVAAWLHDVGYAHLWTPIRQPNQRHEEEHQVTTDKDHDDEDRLLTMAEVATWLGTTERFPRRLVAERRIRFVKVGRHVRFPATAVRKFIDDAHRA